MNTLTPEQFKAKYGENAYNSLNQPQNTESVGAILRREAGKYVKRVEETGKAAIGQAKEAFKASTQVPTPPGQYSPLPSPGQALDIARNLATGVVKTGEAIIAPATAAIEPITRRTIAPAFQAATEAISNVPAVQQFAASDMGSKVEQLSADVKLLSDLVLTLAPLAQPAGTAVRTGTTAAEQAGITAAERAAQIGTRAVPTAETVAAPSLGARLVPPIAPAIGETAAKTGLGATAEAIGKTVTGLAKQAEQIPGRITTNLAARQALEESISSLPSQVAQNAARNGVDLADVRTLYSIPKEQATAVKSLFETARDFSSGNTTVNPIEIVGKPIVERVKVLDKLRTEIGSKLGTESKNLGKVVSSELKPAVIKRLQAVPGLEGITVNSKGQLNFRNTVLSTGETAGDRNAIQAIYNDAVRSGTGYNKHLLRQELFESLGGKKRTPVSITTTQENAYQAIRSALSDVLETKSPQYKTLSAEYRRVVQPLSEIRNLLKSAGEQQDLMNLSAGLLARRITSAAASNPNIRRILQNLDEATPSAVGKTLPSVEVMQDVYNILNRYYDIAPGTGYQALTTTAVDQAGGVVPLVTGEVRKLMGTSSIIQQKAIEDIIKELTQKGL